MIAARPALSRQSWERNGRGRSGSEEYPRRSPRGGMPAFWIGLWFTAGVEYGGDEVRLGGVVMAALTKGLVGGGAVGAE